MIENVSVNILNAAPSGDGCYLPGFGALTLDDGNKVFAIRVDDNVVALPGANAIGWCIALAQFVVEHTASFDKTLLADLVQKVDNLCVDLRHADIHTAAASRLKLVKDADDRTLQ